MKPLVFIYLLLAAVAPSAMAQVMKIYVQERLNVYEKPSKEAKKISVLSRGDAIRISPKLYGQFRKVQITYKGDKQAGYILIDDIKHSRISDKNPSRSRGFKEGSFVNSRSAGIAITGSYYTQAEQSLSVGNSNVPIEESQGASTGVSAFMSWPWKNSFSLRGSLSLRNLNWSSDIKNPSDPTNSGVTDSIGFFGLGGQVNWHFSESGSSWLGLGAEYLIDRGGRERKVAGILDTQQGLEDINLLQTHLSLGTSFSLNRQFGLAPELKVGTTLSESPGIYYFDLGLYFSYFFE